MRPGQRSTILKTASHRADTVHMPLLPLLAILAWLTWWLHSILAAVAVLLGLWLIWISYWAGRVWLELRRRRRQPLAHAPRQR